MTNRRSEAGFTLIEVLLALALSATIASAIYGLLWTGSKTWQRMRQRSEVYQTARVVFDRLQDDLQGSLPIFAGKMQDTFSFEGDATHLSFPARMTVADATQPSFDRPAVGRISYRETQAVPGTPASLTRDWTAYVADPAFSGSTHGSDTFPYIVSRVVFSYPVRAAIREGEQRSAVSWEETWDQPHKLPEGVRVDLSLRHPSTGEEVTLRKIIPIWQGVPQIQAPS